MRGLRKTFATHTFYRYWGKLGSPSAAMEMTAKRMKHSSKGITVTHYIEDGDILRMKQHANKEIHEILKDSIQTNINNFEGNYEIG